MSFNSNNWFGSNWFKSNWFGPTTEASGLVYVSASTSRATGYVYGPGFLISLQTNTSFGTGSTYVPTIVVAPTDIYVAVSTTLATGRSYNPSISAGATVYVTALSATGRTYNPTVGDGSVTVMALLSTAFARTYVPSFPVAEERLRLFEGYPAPSVVQRRNRKVAVIGTRVAYKVGAKYWIKT